METRNIKDFIHLYLGCEMLSKSSGERMGKLLGVVGNEAHFRINGIMYSSHVFNYKLLLRPLSDMNEEEKVWLDEQEEFKADYKDAEIELLYEWNAEETVYLLSKHFDLFGLIEAGLAIDKTKNI